MRTEGLSGARTTEIFLFFAGVGIAALLLIGLVVTLAVKASRNR